MVIDSNLDRYLSNSNKSLEVFDNSNYVEKSRLNQQIHLIKNFTNQSNQQFTYHDKCVNNQSNQQLNPNNRLNDKSIDTKMNHQNAFNDQTNLVKNNNLLKDSNQSINLPINHQNKTTSSDDSEDENDDILEISPCGRWSKRSDQIQQNDIPNLDNSYLAIDGEEGIEVVWNEIRISERKNLQSNDSRINKVFNRLIQLNHNNIVKIHKYWVDKENPRVIFITEYMSGGTLSLFLKKTRSNLIKIKMTLMSWRRWCTQILCALRYLHGQKPKTIIHGNLNCDTIFISHTGLIKIGCVAPNDIHQNVKTMGANTMANFYLLAPEIINENSTEDEINDPSDGIFNKFYSTAIDIYAFGIVALEMAVLGIKNNFNCNNKPNQHNHQQQSNYHSQSHHSGPYSEGNISQNFNNYFSELSGTFVSRETIRKAIDLLDNDLQKDFINRCLNEDPRKRPTAKELLFHPVIFEVPCLKVICANKILNNSSTGYSLEQIDEEFNRRMQNTQNIIAEIHHQNGKKEVRRICDLSKLNTEYLEKFFEEVKNGVYPLYAFSCMKTKISKFLKMKRNTFRSIVENTMKNSNHHKGDPNGLDENLINRQKFNRLDSDQNINQQSINENTDLQNNDQELDDENCDENGEDEYDDQEDDTGSQNEDYDNRCENCTADSYEEETRRIEQIEITLKSTTTGQSLIKNDKLYCLDLNQEIIILLKLDDQMNRKLSCSLSSQSDNGTVLANELVTNGFINSKDRELVEEKINEALSNQNMSFTNLTENQSTACCYSNQPV